MTISALEMKSIAHSLGEGGAMGHIIVPGRAPWMPGLHGLQVLLVEDDEADAYLIRRALALNPRVDDVVLAEDGEEALELLDRRRVFPDLALVDLRMPRKDGLAFLKDLAARPEARFPCAGAHILQIAQGRRAGEDAGRCGIRHQAKGGGQVEVGARSHYRGGLLAGSAVAFARMTGLSPREGGACPSQRWISRARRIRTRDRARTRTRYRRAAPKSPCAPGSARGRCRGTPYGCGDGSAV